MTWEHISVSLVPDSIIPDEADIPETGHSNSID